jgi:hypothetical protein
MFVEGPFGAGKTTFAIETLFAWLEAGIPASEILVIVPQRTLARRYLLALRQSEHGPLGDVQVRTLGGIAKETVNLYWPLIAAEAGFASPDHPPQFLTIETSQYAMADFVTQAVDRGEFDAISVSPQQIARQIVDNLNKAALMGVDALEIPQLLISAWGTERPRKRALAYQAAGRVAQAFRQHCIQNRLLDFSLQLELFAGLLKQPEFQQRFFGRHSYLIAENIEEEPAFTHDLIKTWLPILKGGLLTYETDSGYRIFLGAEPEGALRLRDACDGVLEMRESRISSEGLEALRTEIGYTFRRPDAIPAPPDAEIGFRYGFHTYFPQMLDWAADRIAALVHQEGVPAHEIAILAPFLSDALRFSLDQKLAQRGIATLSHRPSRALRDEPAAHCLLTLTALAHPHWERRPPPADVAQALQYALEGLDPVRAALLAKVIYHPRGKDMLSSFDKIRPEMQHRITYVVGQRYERLRGWLLAYSEGTTAPLDHFFARLFGEVISQPGFGFHTDPDAGRVAAELVESARKFRRELFPTVTSKDTEALDEIGRRYFEIVERGLLAALYVASWRDEQADAVFIAPAYTFLMRSRAVSVQFWLDVGSLGWWERLDQPLTHPYVLSRAWQAGQVWSDADEYDRQQEMLYRLLSGLIRRCRTQIYLGISDFGEQGYEQRGPLLRIFQSILRRHPQAGEAE